MALREDDSRDSKRGMSLGEQIRMWAGTAAKVAVVVVPVFAGLNYMINAEIEPVRKQISNVDVRLDKLEKTVEKEIGRVEGRVDKLEGKVDQLDNKMDDKFEKLGENLAAFRLEVLTWMARNEASQQTSSSQSDGGEEGSADTSSLQPDDSAPTVPISSLPQARETICD